MDAFFITRRGEQHEARIVLRGLSELKAFRRHTFHLDAPIRYKQGQRSCGGEDAAIVDVVVSVIDVVTRADQAATKSPGQTVLRLVVPPKYFVTGDCPPYGVELAIGNIKLAIIVVIPTDSPDAIVLGGNTLQRFGEN